MTQSAVSTVSLTAVVVAERNNLRRRPPHFERGSQRHQLQVRASTLPS
jgi:hypothetical protein